MPVPPAAVTSSAAVEVAIAQVLPGDAGLARAVHAAYNGALLTWGLAGGDDDPADQVREQVRRVLGAASTAAGQ